MNLFKLSAVSAVLLGSVAASPAAFAHASFMLNGGDTNPNNLNINGNNVVTPAGGLEWLNGQATYGMEVQDPAVGANLPIIGFAGIHGATTSNNRVIETGIYGGTAANATYGTPAVTAALLGGSFGNYTNQLNGQAGGAGLTSGNIAAGQGNTLLGQLYNYNTAAPGTTAAPGGTSKNPGGITYAPTSVGVAGQPGTTISVQQGSWSNSLSSDPATNAQKNIIGTPGATAGQSSTYNANGINSGLLYEQPYAGSGSTYTNAENNINNKYGTSAAVTAVGSAPNGEEYIINTTGATYLNVAIAADHNVGTSNFNPTNGLNDYTSLSTGTSDLTYAIYQGTPTGPGLTGLTFLGSGGGTTVGGEVDFSVHLTGSYTNNAAQTAGAFTLVVGDASESTDSSKSNYIAANNFDPYVKIGLFESGTGLTSTGAAVATPNLNGAYSTVYSEQGTAAVPVPGAVWLFGSALAGFVGFGRRKTVGNA